MSLGRGRCRVVGIRVVDVVIMIVTIILVVIITMRLIVDVVVRNGLLHS